MISKRHNFKIFNFIAVLFLVSMLLSACGGFNFQAQTAPSDDGGGIAITGGVDPLAPTDSAPAGQTIAPTTVILLLVGFGVLVLILLLLVRGRSSGDKSS